MGWAAWLDWLAWSWAGGGGGRGRGGGGGQGVDVGDLAWLAGLAELAGLELGWRRPSPRLLERCLAYSSQGFLEVQEGKTYQKKNNIKKT